jgi:predicted HNH restriction endonuclease
MKTSDVLTIGTVYSRLELADRFGITDATLNTGIFRPPGHDSIWLFVTEQKTPDRTQYRDHLDGDDLSWDGQTTGRKDALIIDHEAEGLELVLFYRKSKTEFDNYGFRYEGPFRYISHRGRRPAHFLLRRARVLDLVASRRRAATDSQEVEASLVSVNTYLLTWNPTNWKWTYLEDQARQTREGEPVDERWSVGNTKRIVPGERLFLIKQGPELPNGIMASGRATSTVYEDDHWDEGRAERGETALYVDAEWDTILHVPLEAPLPVSAIESAQLPAVHWNTQRSGIVIHPDVAQHMEALWKQHVGAIRGVAPPDVFGSEDFDAAEFPEGRTLYRLHSFHERCEDVPRRAKELALNKHGRLACVVCGFDFFATYGPVGDGFIECHHTVPVSELTEGMKTKLADVVLVCSNCHRMLHRRRPWLGINELRTLLHR